MGTKNPLQNPVNQRKHIDWKKCSKFMNGKKFLKFNECKKFPKNEWMKCNPMNKFHEWVWAQVEWLRLFSDQVKNRLGSCQIKYIGFNQSRCLTTSTRVII